MPECQNSHRYLVLIRMLFLLYYFPLNLCNSSNVLFRSCSLSGDLLREDQCAFESSWRCIWHHRPHIPIMGPRSAFHGGLPGRNRDKPWSYPTFFRRLRGWASGRGAAARYFRSGARLPGRAHGIAPQVGAGADSIHPQAVFAK